MLKKIILIGMKNIMKNIWVLFALLFLGSCNDYLDVNDDPNNPTAPVMDQLLSGGEYYMTQGLGQGNFIGNELSSYVHQLVSREVQNYGMTAGANGPFNTWNYLYTYALPAYDAIITAGEEDGNLIYAGVAKTLKAYTFSMMVDLWGDIPYSEFNLPGVNAPKPDNSKDIYNSLLTLLEEAQADLGNLTAENSLKPGSDDFFYAGDTGKWKRLNNTIQLKLLVQSRKAKADITGWKGKFDGLIAKNKLIEEGEDFQFWYNTGTTPQDMRHPAIKDYTGQQTYYISPYFYETMMGEIYNTVDNPFAGIVDPRVPYYFYNQLKTGEDAQSFHEYRNDNFMSIFFATNGNNASGSNDKTLTKIGIYPAGGKYDDGEGGSVELAKEYGEAPHKMVTYFSLQFMLAELALAGDYKTPADAREHFENAVKASLKHVNSVAQKQSGVPLIDGTKADTTFVKDVLTKFDAADADGKMRIVMTQKWIANFFNPIDIYTDYRRTGYPVLFDPANTEDPGNGVNPTVEDNSPAEVPLMNIASFPRSLYYPTNSETELNSNVNQKANLSTPFVFWDKN